MARVARTSASPSTPPSTGPMHGVQPKAKAMPRTGGAHGPSREGRGWKRRSMRKRPGVPRPSTHTPKRITTAPDTTSSWR